MKQDEVFYLKNVRKVFNDNTVALDNFSISIKKGVTVIIGPSGSGKSTILRLLNLLEKPTSGSIIYNDSDITLKGFNLSEHRMKVTMVFQNFNLFPHLTVLENLNIAQENVLKKNTKNATITSLNYLEDVGLVNKANSYPSQLSGGQKQRIAIARALCMDPDVILFDEPTSALDPEMIKEVLIVMKRLIEKGKTMIIVTHEMSFAKNFADEILVIDEGKLVERGSSVEVFLNPKNDRTRRFLESMDYYI